MFDPGNRAIGLWPGEGPEVDDYVDYSYELTCRLVADVCATDTRQVLPGDLEAIPPGTYLAAIVSSIDTSRLNGYDAVRMMKASARLAAHNEAAKYEAMAQVAYAPPSDPDSGVLRSSEVVEYAAVEVAAALTLTRRSSEDQLSRSVTLTGVLVRVWKAFSAGVIDLPKVRVFEQSLGHLPKETVDVVLDLILDEAASLTNGQIRSRLSRLVLEADPDGAASSFEQGLADRNILVFSNPDHTADLQIRNARPEDVVAARSYVEEIARSLKTADEPRTLEQIRTDVALDLLQGRRFGTGRQSRAGRVNVTVSAETLGGLSNEPGVLDGYGPVFAEIARKTVMENVDGEWIFTVTDQGRPVATGTLARRPTGTQKRRVRAEYPTCTFVGCRQPGHDCDLDHRHPFAQGGSTHNDNLEPLCRHHHMVRHHTPWRLERRVDGEHEWTSPLGHVYVKRRGPPD
jgi:hypothetical protein